MRIAIIVNEQRKETPQLEYSRLDKDAKINHLSYDLVIVKPEQIPEIIKELLSKAYHGFIIAGGDGTVRCAAQLFIEQDVPLAILPLGTFNNFARELGFANDIDSLFKI